jgi:hypothetical protein
MYNSIIPGAPEASLQGKEPTIPTGEKAWWLWTLCRREQIIASPRESNTGLHPLAQGWAIVLARGPLCGSVGWRRAAPFKIIAFIS